MDNLTIRVINKPVIVYPSVQFSEEESKGVLVEGFIQFDLSSFHDFETIKVILSGTERQNKMSSQDPKTGEMQLVPIGQRSPILSVAADLTYMFVGGPVPSSSLQLQPGNHM